VSPPSFSLIAVANDIYARYTKQTISDLLQNKVDMSQLVITKALSKNGELLASLRRSQVKVV
jgi:hypothetical protein